MALRCGMGVSIAVDVESFGDEKTPPPYFVQALNRALRVSGQKSRGERGAGACHNVGDVSS